MKVIFIRHSKTLGNTQKRYIGTTDEGLCSEGISLAMKVESEKLYPECDMVVLSPMKRCEQTKRAIYPLASEVYCDKLKECDFGDFENKNYMDLQENEDYQKWIDSNGKMPFPNGESHLDFVKRCVSGFKETYDLLKKQSVETVCFVVHGGTIMSIMEKFCDEKKSFYDYQVGNCEGYITEVSENKKGNIKMQIVKKVTL